MPYTIKLDHVPAGYAAHSAEEGDRVQVICREFTSTEDGQLFVSRLEGTPTQILEKISGSAGAAASQTDSLLAIIRPDGLTKVYWNEFQPIVQVRSKKKIKAGELVFIDHIMDIEDVRLPNDALADDVGVLYVFSFGWRKGLFFDFGPAQTAIQRVPRNYNLGATLAHCFSRVLFQHLFSIDAATWSEFFKQRWFPFSYLSVATVRNMVTRARERRAIDGEIDVISSEVKQVVTDRLTEWANDEVISPHLQFVRTAFDRFCADDYISAASILYPRIEGLIRTCAPRVGSRLTQKLLSKLGAGTEGALLREESLLLPKRFEQYLEEVYFADFRPGSLSRIVSRHSVSHGVVSAESLDRKATVVGFLTLLQLFSVAKARGIQLKSQLKRPSVLRQLFRLLRP